MALKRTRHTSASEFRTNTDKHSVILAEQTRLLRQFNTTCSRFPFELKKCVFGFEAYASQDGVGFGNAAEKHSLFPVEQTCLLRQLYKRACPYLPHAVACLVIYNCKISAPSYIQLQYRSYAPTCYTRRLVLPFLIAKAIKQRLLFLRRKFELMSSTVPTINAFSNRTRCNFFAASHTRFIWKYIRRIVLGICIKYIPHRVQLSRQLEIYKWEDHNPMLCILLLHNIRLTPF